MEMRKDYVFGGYFWRPEKSKIIDFGPSVSETLDWDHNGVLQDWQAAAGFQVDLTKQTTLNISRGEAFERFDNIGFRRHSTTVLAATQPFKWISLSTRYTQGTQVNFFPAPGLLPFLANSRLVNFGLTPLPSPRSTFNETLNYYTLGMRTGVAPLFSPGKSVFNN